MFEEAVEHSNILEQEEPISEELEEAIEKSFVYHNSRGDDFRSDKQIETAYRYGFEAGAKWQKEQVIEKAVEFFENDLCCYIKAQCFTIEHGRLENDFRKHVEED